MPEQIIITIPLPPRELSPNDRVHWGKKHRASQAYRRDACTMTGAAGGCGLWWSRALATPIFFFPYRRRRDLDNLQAMLKPAYDGIVDAGAIVDDSSEHLEHGRPIIECDRKNPRVEIVLKKL